jgi:2-amino-4-hydroxy-6-hydroxymethyldihydropteridine diphosphokinase
MYSYFVGLGSNVNPYINVTIMLQELLNLSEEVDVSRIIETHPVGFESDNNFLNLSVHIKTEENAYQLKERFNAIETKLGRDRTDINKKLQDCVADLDILFPLNEQESVVKESLLPSEPYKRPTLVELIHFLGFECNVPTGLLQEGIGINIDNVLIGRKPVTLSKEKETKQIILIVKSHTQSGDEYSAYP